MHKSQVILYFITFCHKRGPYTDLDLCLLPFDPPLIPPLLSLDDDLVHRGHETHGPGVVSGHRQGQQAFCLLLLSENDLDL